MRSVHTVLVAGVLALGTMSAALAQDSSTRNGQQQWRPFGFPQSEPQAHQRELNYKEWKNSDEAREFSRSEYSGKIKN
jgi:hypothetical protein